MLCVDTKECFKQINMYFDGNRTGYFLIVNTENYDVFQEILQRLQADSKKKCIYVSEHRLPNGLPDVNRVVSSGAEAGEYVLVGISQALMLRGESALERSLDEIISWPINGHGIVLLDHCEQMLDNFVRNDIRLNNRIVLTEGLPSELPYIKITKNPELSIGNKPFADFCSLLGYLEKITDAKQKKQKYLSVVSNFNVKMFSNSMYPISEIDGVYEMLADKYADISGAAEKNYGDDEQWRWLLSEMRPYDNLSTLICDIFGSISNLSIHLNDVIEEGNEYIKWLLWLALKVFGESNNKYLTYVLLNSQSYDDFERHIYLDLADIDIQDSDFERALLERRRLLRKLPDNSSLVIKYCEKLGRYQKNEIYYLSDDTERERYEFFRCLSTYDYSEKEFEDAVKGMSKALTLYMTPFAFDVANTKLAASDIQLHADLTEYFKQYKVQKLKNNINPKFLDIVNKYAVSRPYNKLQARSSIVSHLNRTNMQVFFFDALGVEYLSFVIAKCEEYGLMSEVHIGRCELPSITVKNKEFLQYFDDGDWFKIDDLDEIKHHSQIYNYQKCEYPIHLFEELEIIDTQLRRIQSMLMQGIMDKALIVSDHGASRLAVLYGHETPAAIKLDESGEHSGRCCPAESDPGISFAAYEDGFSVLANYDRFKGGRKANVEVHGGASLEEVLVPVIMLTRKPDNIEMCFVDSTIYIIPRTDFELVLYSNVPLEEPYLYIDNESYKGEFMEDKKHVRFNLGKMRKGTYTASVYDGDRNMSVTLDFEAKKKTREVDLF